MESAINNTAGFQERLFSNFRSPVYWFIHKQRYQRGAGFRLLPHIHNHAALFTRVSIKLAEVPNTIFRAENQQFRIASKWRSKGNRNSQSTRRAQMKTSSYLSFAGLMVVGVLLTTSCASAQFSDAMAHNDSGSGTATLGNCTLHMPSQQYLKPNPVTFKLCVGYSGATEWSLEIRKNTSPYQLVTGCSWSRRSVSQSTFQCNITQTGNYRANIMYYVNGNPFPHTDKVFVR
jgi:hypothetical protein